MILLESVDGFQGKYHSLNLCNFYILCACVHFSEGHVVKQSDFQRASVNLQVGKESLLQTIALMASSNCVGQDT